MVSLNSFFKSLIKLPPLTWLDKLKHELKSFYLSFVFNYYKFRYSSKLLKKTFKQTSFSDKVLFKFEIFDLLNKNFSESTVIDKFLKIDNSQYHSVLSLAPFCFNWLAENYYGGPILDLGSFLNQPSYISILEKLEVQSIVFTRSKIGLQKKNFDFPHVCTDYTPLQLYQFQQSFNTIVCLSFIEVINFSEFSSKNFFKPNEYSFKYHDQIVITAISTMLRLLKPRGSLLISFPCGPKNSISPYTETQSFHRVFDYLSLSKIIECISKKTFDIKLLHYSSNKGQWCEDVPNQCSFLDISNLHHNPHSVSFLKITGTKP